jgi:hypothetical protein
MKNEAVRLIPDFGQRSSRGANALSSRDLTDINFEGAVLKPIYMKRIALLALALMTVGCMVSRDARAGQRGRGDREWSGRSKQERLDYLTRILNRQMENADAEPEVAFLHSRASELLERAKLAMDKNFQFDRLAAAVDNLLKAIDKITTARRSDRTEDRKKRETALFLQKCYFRLQQASYFAGLSNEKEAEQYEAYTRSLYQQARSAYDAQLYERAQLLGEASSLIVMALENIAHASMRIPDPPVIK